VEASALAGGDRSALVFIGFMGAGKTTAARAAAAALGARAVDADDAVVERLGTPIDEHFATHGEGSFRAVEEEVVCGLLDAPPGPVLSLGGGAVTSPRVREALARHIVVLLDVDADVAWRRVGGRRPATAPASGRCMPSARASTRRSPTRSCPAPAATWCAARCPR
jgi:shikimate kinase/3-dehydroquinate synthase